MEALEPDYEAFLARLLEAELCPTAAAAADPRPRPRQRCGQQPNRVCTHLSDAAVVWVHVRDDGGA